MKLKNVTVENYKSIEKIEFPIENYNDSHTTIFLGKNETGKSNILDSLALLSLLYDDKGKFDFYGIRNQKNEPDEISTSYLMESEDVQAYQDAVASVAIMPDELKDNIFIISATKKISLSKGESTLKYEWIFQLKPFSVKRFYWVEETIDSQTTATQKAKDKETKRIIIRNKSDIEKEDLSNYTQLTCESLKELIEPTLEEYFDNHEIRVTIWKALPNYLIGEEISLRTFAEEPNQYPPLLNIFSIAGISGKDAISDKINEVERKSNARRILAKMLSGSTTSYIKERWKEHDILIDVDISDELNIHVKVQDADDENSYYNMDDRSQGFKQFISLLLSISADHSTGKVRNQLILIDEPEVHLHPSGIRYMLNELLEIDKENYVFIATHSNFMIDNKSEERHYVVTKNKGITGVKQVSLGGSLNDDEILQSAFGINVIRDYVSKRKLLVEGASDKVLLEKVLYQIDKNNGIVISNGNGSNIVSIASVLGYHEITPLVVLDDDEIGRKSKNEIIKIGNGFSVNTVFTIRDLCGLIKNDGTIEDVLPIEYVQSNVNSILATGKVKILPCNLKEDEPYCKQILLHLQKSISEENISKRGKKKQIEFMMKEIKTAISENYNEKRIEDHAPILWALAKAISEKIGQMSCPCTHSILSPAGLTVLKMIGFFSSMKGLKSRYGLTSNNLSSSLLNVTIKQ
jgi:AAA15 family ATPase/GTPase